MAFVDKAKPLRDKAKVTLKQVADECGISESMASRYFSGAVVPPSDIADRILDYLASIAPVTRETDMIHHVYTDTITHLRRDRDNWQRIAVGLLIALGVTLIGVIGLLLLFYWDMSHPNMGNILYSGIVTH